jgi:hypothetical protein
MSVSENDFISASLFLCHLKVAATHFILEFPLALASAVNLLNTSTTFQDAL